MNRLLAAMMATACAIGASALEVNNVTAAQRKPWANIIDIDYEISGAAETSTREMTTRRASGGARRTIRVPTTTAIASHSHASGDGLRRH